MAEIPIERKPARNWLPLILAAVVVLLVLGYCATRNRDQTAVATASDTASSAVGTDTLHRMAATTTADSALEQFRQFNQQPPAAAANPGETPHQYAGEGIRLLAAAIEAVGTGVNVAVYADSMRSSVARMQASSVGDMHSDDVKAAFSAAVSAMDEINRSRGKTIDMAAIRSIYNELNSTQLLLPQRAVAERFFKAAADALQAMRA
ncbi:MAG: hypothetical protein ABI120_15110 [Gemmatimonadaceae bacterium]